MPIKYNLTKHDMLAEKIHKLASRDQEELSTGDVELEILAIIVTSFSSNHSWKTFQAITNGTDNYSSPEIKDDYAKAKTKWKQLKSQDLQQLAGCNIPDYKFYRWMNQNVEKDKHEAYKLGWAMLNKEFNEDCDDISAKL